jgi:pimeloyl-ACP methyl ester carboxylesterase
MIHRRLVANHRRSVISCVAGRRMLELIDNGRCGDNRCAPLVFVHGEVHAAWCWDEHFIDFFAGHGYRALALSLRGHGASPTAKRLKTCSIVDYVDDLRSVAAGLPVAPVVVGHSMGGFVVQKYLESSTAPAAVLMASLPPQGRVGFLTRQIRRHPWVAMRALATGKLVRMFDTPERAREFFFSAHTPESDVQRCLARLQEESARVPIDMTLLSLPRPKRVSAPM